MSLKTHVAQIAGNANISTTYGQEPIAPMGNVFVVDSTKTGATDSAAGFGYSPESPFATLAYASQTAVVTGNMDTIRLMPGHAEAIVAAAGITISKNNIIIDGGVAVGRARATITFSTATTAQLIISGANITFKNVVFDFTGIDAIVAAISITGADVAFENCDFLTQSATAGCVLGILTAATASRLKFTGCRFLGVKTSSGTTVTACIQHEVGENVLISGCQFFGKMTQAILNATTSVLGLIDSCHFHIFTGTKGVSVAAATQWTVRNCTFIVASGTAPIVGTVVNVIGNAYSTEGVGVSAGSAKTF